MNKQKQNQLNSIVAVYNIEKNGKKYSNLVVNTTLENGEIVTYEVKLAFYNRKFAYKLRQNLPIVTK